MVSLFCLIDARRFIILPVAFRRSAEPLFDASHVDSDCGLTKNFAGCLNSTAFLNALMYSIMQAEDHDRAPESGLALKIKSIQHISNAISLGNESTYIPLIGAIMMLKAIAVSFLSWQRAFPRSNV